MLKNLLRNRHGEVFDVNVKVKNQNIYNMPNDLSNLGKWNFLIEFEYALPTQQIRSIFFDDIGLHKIQEASLFQFLYDSNTLNNCIEFYKKKGLKF